MATTNAGSFTVARQGVYLTPDGTTVVTLLYANATSANHIVTRSLNIPSNASLPITDEAGSIISATVPAALASAIASFLSQLDTSIANGAAAGKLNL